MQLNADDLVTLNEVIAGMAKAGVPLDQGLTVLAREMSRGRLQRATEGIAADLTSHARFLDRLEKRNGAWKLVERAAVYERDRLDPVEPSAAFK